MSTITSVIVWEEVSTWRVLVVDDEVDNIEVVSDILSYRGATVQTAANGALALNALPAFAANLILLDLSMPVLNGWETCARLKADEQTRAIPVIALSAHAMVGDKERALAAGFDGYLSKPINVTRLPEDIHASYHPAQPSQNMQTHNLPPAEATL